MEKFKDLLRKKKVYIPLVLTVLIAIGLAVGLNMGKGDVKINPDKINSLISANYESEILKEDEKKVELNIIGNLSDEDVDELVSSLFKLGSNWGKEEILINIFNTKDDVKDVDKLYVEGLRNQIIINYLTSTAKVGRFESIPKVETAKNIVDYNKGEIGYNDGYVTVKVDMAVEGESVDIVGQAKSFIVMFREINKDKEISNVQMDINHGSDHGYSFSTEFENIVKDIKTIKF